MSGADVKPSDWEVWASQVIPTLRKRGYVVLTPEEAEHIYHDLCLGESFDRPFTRSRALLSPDEADDD